MLAPLSPTMIGRPKVRAPTVEAIVAVPTLMITDVRIPAMITGAASGSSTWRRMAPSPMPMPRAAALAATRVAKASRQATERGQIILQEGQGAGGQQWNKRRHEAEADDGRRHRQHRHRRKSLADGDDGLDDAAELRPGRASDED